MLQFSSSYARLHPRYKRLPIRIVIIIIMTISAVHMLPFSSSYALLHPRSSYPHSYYYYYYYDNFGFPYVAVVVILLTITPTAYQYSDPHSYCYYDSFGFPHVVVFVILHLPISIVIIIIMTVSAFHMLQFSSSYSRLHPR